MTQARPRIVSRLREHSEAVAAAEAALEEGLALLPLVNTPEAEGTHELHIYLLGAGRPMVVLAEIAGVENGSRFPLMLRPVEVDGRERIRAFLNDIGQRAARTSAPPPPSRTPAAVKSPSVDALPVVTSPRRSSASSWAAVQPRAPVSSRSGGASSLTGKYTLGEPLRPGASVYSAVQSGLEKKLAVKVMRASAALQPDVLTTFQRVALAASEIDHPNVARVLDFGHAPLFVAMDLLPGVELRSVLRDAVALPLPRIVAIASQICAALSVAHERGVVHRDLKPANVFLLPSTDDDGQPTEIAKVKDFGIAEIVASLRFLDATSDPIMATGTPQYMAPEVVRGERPTSRSDIYACGVILYEMATGRLPFPAPANAQEMLRLQASPPAPSTVAAAMDRDLERIILKAMRKDPDGRYASARDLRSELRALLGGARSSPSAVPASLRPPSAGPATRLSRPPPLAPPPVFAPPSRPVAREEPTFEIPMSTRASERPDALEIDFSHVPTESARGMADVRNQPAWVALELTTGSLRTDPEGVLGPLDKIPDLAQYATEMKRLDLPISTLASRGEAIALRALIAALKRRIGDASPSETTKGGIAALRLSTLAKQKDALMPLARVAIDGSDIERGAAFAIVVASGAGGAQAACAARKRPPEPAPEDCGRFAAMIRDIGAPAIAPVCEALKGATPGDRPFIEDLLDALGLIQGAASTDLAAGATLADLMTHESPTIRKKAAVAFAAVSGARSHTRLLSMLKTETEDTVRVGVIDALRKTRGIGRDAILQMDAFVNGAGAAGVELKIAAATALGEADPVARPQAAGVLARAVKPPQQGLLTKLVGGEADDVVLVTTIAKSLLAVGGADAAALVESRAAKSAPDVKQKLLELLHKRS